MGSFVVGRFQADLVAVGVDDDGVADPQRASQHCCRTRCPACLTMPYRGPRPHGRRDAPPTMRHAPRAWSNCVFQMRAITWISNAWQGLLACECRRAWRRTHVRQVDTAHAAETELPPG